MKKSIFALLLFPVMIFAQNKEDMPQFKDFTFEQLGNKIKISYNISNLKVADKVVSKFGFNVEGGKQGVIEHATGHIGEVYVNSVDRTGVSKGEIEWDVLKQYEELKGTMFLECNIVIERIIATDNGFEPLEMLILDKSEEKYVNIPVEIKDVDNNIPIAKEANKNTFALVIGNENYKEEIKVPYALHDAEIFAQYCYKTLGIPEKQVHLLKDATYGQMLGEIKWLKDIIDVFEGEANVVLYYAGHGMPDETDMNAYILPVDGNSTIPQTAIKVDELYAQLTDKPANSIAVFLDACFSGAARDGKLAKGRAVMLKPKTNIVKGNMFVLSATTEKETAFPYEEKKHGLFTYFLLEKLQDSKGDVSLQELTEHVQTNVKRQSVIINQKRQTPNINVSNTFSNWKEAKLIK